MNWFLAAVKKYATFSGRAQRSEYWYFFLFWWLIYIGLILLESFALGGLFGSASENSGGVLASLFVIGMFLPSIAVSVRRLHDTNRSGWWFLLNALPFIGWLVLFIFNVQDSQSGANSFGPNPKGIGDNQATGESIPVRGSKALIIGISCAIAIPVLGIILAVALPAYQDYTKRAQRAEASANARTPGNSAKQASTARQVPAVASAPAMPVAPPPAAPEAVKPAIETANAPAVPLPAVNAPPPQPVAIAPAPAKATAAVVERKPKAREEQAPIRVVSDSAEPPKRNLSAKKSECVYKPVMTDEDIEKCR